LLWCVYAGSSFEVKIETDGNDAVEIKTEVDCVHHDHPYAGMSALSDAVSPTDVPKLASPFLHSDLSLSI